MTTGSRSFGSDYDYGAMASKVWSGQDYSHERPASWPPLVVRDYDGNVLTDRQHPLYHAGLIRARADAIRAGRAKSKRLRTEDHAYACSWTKHLNGKLWFWNGALYEYPHFSMFGKYYGQYMWDENDDLKLIGKLRTKLQGSDFNLGVFLAEAPMALRMISESAITLASALRYARKGNFREAARALTRLRRGTSVRQTSANSWLELQYGWLPLLQDMTAGAEYLAHQLFHSPQHVVRVTRIRDGTLASNGPIFTDYGVSWATTRKSIIARITEVDQVKLVGLTDPLSLAWEMLPGSFLLDWLAPIGDFLSARGVSNSLQGTFVTTRADRYYWKASNDSFSYSGLQWHGAKSSFSSGGSMSRSVSTSLDVPMPTFKPLDKIASWQHTANAVALLQQVIAARSVR